MKIKMKTLLKENRAFLVPLNSLINIVETENEDLSSVFMRLESYNKNPKNYTDVQYETEIKKVLKLINDSIASNNILLSQARFVIKKTK